MKLTKEAIISIVLVVLFVGSIFGFAFSGASHTGSNTNNSSTDKQIDSNLPVVLYKTTIDSNVFDIYPQIIFLSKTTNYNAQDIQDKLDSLDNVSKSQASFSKDQNSQVMLIGRVIYTDNAKDQIIKNIKDMNFLSDIQFYQTAMATIPTNELTLVSDNNTTKKYTFTNPSGDAIITTDTQKGDTIKAQLQVAFQGNTAKSTQIIEIQNATAQPQLVMGSSKLKINKWIPMFKVDANSDLDVNAQKNTIDKLLDTNTSFESKIIGTLDYNLSDTNTSAINSYLKKQKNMNNSIITSYIADKNKTSISFNKDMNYSKYLELYNYLDNNYGTKLLSTPSRNYEIVWDANDINTPEVSNLLANINLKISSISKQAEMNTINPIINDKNYSYDKNTNVWLAYPVDLNKTEINLNTQGYAQRNKLMVIILKEN